MEEMIKSIAQQLKEKLPNIPEIAIVLGSGLSELVDEMEEKVIIPYAEIKNMPLTNVLGHKNQFIYGKLQGKYVIAMQGRFHLYNGFTAKQTTMPIYVFKLLGVKTLILTNAAGGINDNFNPGDIVLIVDHINNTRHNCLIGGESVSYGKDFIDMTEPYDIEYRNKILNIAKNHNIELKQGTYIQYIGPFYETKADIKMAKIVGADMVGMSTVLEVEAAVHCGLKTLALSVITNKAAGLSTKTMSHEEVLMHARTAQNKLKMLLNDFISEL